MISKQNWYATLENVRHSLSAWLPFICLMLAMGVSNLLIKQVLDCGQTENSCLNPFEPMISPLVDADGERIGVFGELSGRLGWMISVLLFLLSITAMFVVALRTLSDSLQSRQVSLACYVCIVGIVALFSPLALFRQDYNFNTELLGETVYAVSSAKLIVDYIQGLGASGLLVVAFALSVLLWRARERMDELAESSTEAQAAELALFQERIRSLLYLAAFALVAGTLQSSTLYSWAITLMQPDVLVEGEEAIVYFDEASDIPAAMTFLNGSFYSILLATAFVPAMVYIRYLALSIARKALPNSPPQDRKEWLTQHASEESLLQYMTSIVVMLGPILAGGPLASLLEFVG